MARPKTSDKASTEEAPGAEERGGVNGLRSTASIAMLTAAFLVAVPYASPKLWRFRLLTPLPEGAGLVTVPPPAAGAAAPAASVGETALVIETTEQSELRQPEEAAALPPEAAAVLPKGVDEAKPPVSIEDLSGRALDAFFGKLVAAERKDPKAIARITYYGDSIVATDHVTGTMRRKFQRRFGDAG
ncbi:MAG TPA: hypothetical protein VK459_21195, partial [Polyangiaceae bacterium]|nr:hypothetical protein [Polyangiaceae bacterium]